MHSIKNLTQNLQNSKCSKIVSNAPEFWCHTLHVSSYHQRSFQEVSEIRLDHQTIQITAEQYQKSKLNLQNILQRIYDTIQTWIWAVKCDQNNTNKFVKDSECTRIVVGTLGAANASSRNFHFLRQIIDTIWSPDFILYHRLVSYNFTYVSYTIQTNGKTISWIRVTFWGHIQLLLDLWVLAWNFDTA